MGSNFSVSIWYTVNWTPTLFLLDQKASAAIRKNPPSLGMFGVPFGGHSGAQRRQRAWGAQHFHELHGMIKFDQTVMMFSSTYIIYMILCRMIMLWFIFDSKYWFIDFLDGVYLLAWWPENAEKEGVLWRCLGPCPVFGLWAPSLRQVFGKTFSFLQATAVKWGQTTGFPPRCDPAQMSSSSTARGEKAAHVLSKARWKWNIQSNWGNCNINRG